MRKIISLIGFFLMIQISCNKDNNTVVNPNSNNTQIDTNTINVDTNKIQVYKNNIQGTWLEQYDTTIGYFALDFAKITFKNDSFFIKIEFADDQLFPNDPCRNNYFWNEYAKGIFTVSNSKIILNGIYTDSFFVSKNSGCYNFGKFNKDIEASFTRSGNLKFTNCKLFDKNSTLKNFELKKIK